MKILDLTAGYRACWFDRNDKRATFVDIRPEVAPDFVANSCDLPAEIQGPFDLVVFDPPHKNNGAQFGMARSYGRFSSPEITELLSGAAREAWRLTHDKSLMAFKWNDHNRKLESVLKLLQPYWVPLLCHGISPQQARSKSYWSLLTRSNAQKEI